MLPQRFYEFKPDDEENMGSMVPVVVETNHCAMFLVAKSMYL